MRLSVGTGAAQPAATGTIDQVDGRYWTLFFFDGAGAQIWSEDDLDHIVGPVATAMNTTIASVMARIGTHAATAAGEFFNGSINLIEVIPWTADAATLAALRARLAQRTA